MKKALSVLLTLVMVVGFGSFTFTGAAAETTQDGQQDASASWMKGSRDIHKLARLFQENEQPAADDPKEKEVIIRFADPESADLSKAEADKIETVQTMSLEDTGAKGSKKIEIASGITVKSDEVWDFSDGKSDDSVTVAVATSENLSTEKMIRKLESQDMIEAVSPNYSRHICADGDAYRGYQWALEAYPGIGVDSEWYEEDGETEKNVGSAENIVAVIDTGIYYNHPDLKEQIWNNPFGSKLKGKHGFDFVNADTNPEDDNGHGSHCAGIIGAATNGTGIQGVNQKVSLMALKVLDEEGSGWDSDIIAAFNYIYKAMDMGANVVSVNCSFGGEDADPIMEEVINKIGEKGAVTVCAAGNEEMNCDTEPSYPACYDSEYIISVAATKSSDGKAELVSFSNYGEDSVDVAAPGTDILSTVSYDCFNPTLYGNDENIVQTYLDGEDDSISMLTEPEYPYLTNMSADDIESSPEAGFFSGKGIRIRFDNSKLPAEQKPSWQYVAIPYDLPDGVSEEDEPGNVAHSLMIRTLDGPQDLSYDQYMAGTFSKVLVLDVPRACLDPSKPEGEEFLKKSGVDILMSEVYGYQIVAGNDDYWSHLNISMAETLAAGSVGAYSDESEQPDPERALLILGSTDAGSFTAYIDDIGTSQYVHDESVFGKYDFYSGTSMAAPYVAGAAALVKAAHLEDKDFGPEMLIGDIMSMVNDDPQHKLMKGKKRAVNTDGPIDFAKQGTGFWVGISSVTVDTAKKQLTLKGRFSNGDDLDLRIKKPGAEEAETVPESAVVSKTEDGGLVKEIVLKDNGWINNVFDITVSKTVGEKTKTSTKRAVYAVKGKKNYSTLSEGGSDIAVDAALATNGKRIYAAQSTGDMVLYMNPGSKSYETEEITNVSKAFVKKNYTMAKKMSKTASYDFRFGDDLVMIGSNLYVKGSFCEVTGNDAGEDDDWSDGAVTASSFESSDDSDDRFEDSAGPAYAEESYILKINVSTGKISKVAWPKNSNADMLTDSKLASYNGSLYLLGGMNESDDSFSNKVYCYNASKNTWAAKGNLPEGRAGGKVLQTGDTLVYTLGYTADNAEIETAPANYVFDGKKWTKKTSTLKPIVPDRTQVSRGEKDYCVTGGSVGICKGGLVYIGAPVENYGDTFVYNVSKDSYAGTAYNYTKNMDDVYDIYTKSKQINGIAVADRIFGSDEEDNVIGIPAGKAIKSGLVTVKTSIRNGTMTGKGTFMPGTSRTVKATAKPGYYVKSLKFAGKSGKAAAKGMTVTALVTKDTTATAKTAKLKVSSVKSLTLKQGKTGKLKAKITPAAAAKQWKLAYKSSNTKYATVTAKGVVKASKNKAAKGKTVKIRIMIKGTNKTMKTVKVKIK